MTFHLTNTPALSRQESFLDHNDFVAPPRAEGIVEATEQSPLLPRVAQEDLETGSVESSLPGPSTDSKRRPYTISSGFRLTFHAEIFLTNSSPAVEKARWMDQN